METLGRLPRRRRGARARSARRSPGRERDAVTRAPDLGASCAPRAGSPRASWSALGVGKGTRVGLLCPNRPEWLPIAFGALRLGAVLVPFSTLWKREEIAYALAHGDVQVLLTRAGFLKHDYLADLRRLVPELRRHRAGTAARRRVPGAAPRGPARAGTRRRGGTRGVERWDELAPGGRRRVPRRARAHACRRPTSRPSSSRRARRRRRRRSCTRTARSPLSARRIGECLGIDARRRVVGAHAALLERRLHHRRARRRIAGGGRHRAAGAGRRRQRARAARGRALHDHGGLASGGSAARASGLRAAAGCALREGLVPPARRPPAGPRPPGRRHVRHERDGHLRRLRALRRSAGRAPRDVRPAARRHGRPHRRSGDRAARRRRASRARSS